MMTLLVLYIYIKKEVNKRIKMITKSSLHSQVQLQCPHRTSPCPQDRPHRHSLRRQEQLSQNPPGLIVDGPYCGTVYRYVQVKHKFTCIFKEPLQAPFTGEGLLLTDLWRFVFSKHAVDETQGLVTSTAVILKTVQLGQKTLAVPAFNMAN